ncbi:hypothetical protein [Streptomyces rectiverticillatus]|uniref:hypothetical protein n=1 Tax=Streptomyces rectiverticillatus TaxID=173860 RepID=UPI0015C393C0|nr:hypothetical protein [Streptomyces rectiverticillatus]
MTAQSEQAGSKSSQTSCLKCTVLVVRRAAALRQGPGAVKEIDARQRQHVSEAHQ